MYCRHCGEKIDDDSKFCKYCGKNVEETEQIKKEKPHHENLTKPQNVSLKSQEEPTEKDIIIIANEQLFAIKVIAILSIILYSSILIFGISYYDLYDPEYAFGIILLYIIFFGGFIVLSSIALVGLNRKRVYAITVCRAVLILFAFWTGLIPTGVIILALFWRRLKNPVVKSYLNYKVEEKIQNERLVKTSSTKKDKVIIWLIIIVVILVLAVSITTFLAIRLINLSNTPSSDRSSDYSDYEHFRITSITATRTIISPNESTKIFLKFNDYAFGVKTTWSCTKGKFTNKSNDSVNWTAPNEYGTFAIGVNSKLNNQSDSKFIIIEVKKDEDSKVSFGSEFNEAKTAISSIDNINYISTKNTYGYNLINTESNFLDEVYILLVNEYEPVFNYTSLYHKKGWIFNESAEIVLEETFLVKLEELSKKLISFSYPERYHSYRDNLVNISKEI
jgi:hypothetical protein